MIKKILIISLTLSSLFSAQNADGKKVFETYCWGCHHQSAQAFGPSFTEIANKRTLDEIKAYVIEPKAMYKAFGYKRTVMTQLKLNDQEIDTIAEYVHSFKGK